MRKLKRLVCLLVLTGIFHAPLQARDKNSGYLHDKDGEFVLNSLGECIRTSSWTAETAIPKCEGIEEERVADADQDGIADNSDKCPATPAGVMVDAKGCELKKSFVLEGVSFVTGSDEITAASRSVLNEVAETLIRNGDVNVEVAGYTDDRGNSDFNQTLSQKRAESVKAYLQSSGVAASRMIVKGYGEDSPIADNSTAEGRAKNRRVELHIIN